VHYSNVTIWPRVLGYTPVPLAVVGEESQAPFMCYAYTLVLSHRPTAQDEVGSDLRCEKSGHATLMQGRSSPVGTRYPGFPSPSVH
jgi:hypothetical protein